MKNKLLLIRCILQLASVCVNPLTSKFVKMYTFRDIALEWSLKNTALT